LAAAREVFSSRGHDASMSEIARHAGVGVGSIYRRYPTKDALVEALRVNAVSDAARLAHDVANAVGDSPVASVICLVRKVATALVCAVSGSPARVPPGLSPTAFAT
ncbi:helix-turn-helix domain-containing protein, partial [Rhizobium johnstonii]|uniref:helix-turn-helix domain-containing protein n=1 Tax=Rhizobium johnstonii TaxID=3019933 RepID=UPI003F9A5090